MQETVQIFKMHEFARDSADCCCSSCAGLSVLYVVRFVRAWISSFNC